jgi:anti-sigma B factor antagonist
MSEFKVVTKELNNIVVIATEGYLNNTGGEAIAAVCNEKMAEGKYKFLLNMGGTKVVNSIGVSILIEIIEKLQEVDGRLGYCNLAPIVNKTFTIMGISKYSSIFETEEEGISAL